MNKLTRDTDIAGADIEITGLVTGVGFRYFAQRRAAALGLKGFVRNMQDNSVEVTVEGERAKIEEFHAQLLSGPDGAQITNVSFHWKSAHHGFSDFTIEPTR